MQVGRKIDSRERCSSASNSTQCSHKRTVISNKKNPVQLKGVHTVQKDITRKNHNVAVNIILLIK